MAEAERPRFSLAIDGATVLTADPARPLVENGLVGVQDGRIALVAGLGERPRAFAAERRIDGAGRVVTPGFVNVHTHTILSMVRGVAEDMGFAPAYTPGVPHGHEVTPEEAVALARLGAVEALLFGSTLINDSYVHADATLPAMGELGLRVFACGRIHDVDFSRLHEGVWEHDDAIGERTLGEAVALALRWHGALDGRLGVQLAAHAPDTCSRALLERVREARDRLDLRVNTHLAQSRTEVARVAERDGRTPAELLDGLGLLDDRLIAAHCLFLADGDIARVGRAGTHVAHIPKGNATGGFAAPTNKLRRAGARLALATDNMHADMVEVMRWGLNVGRLQDGAVTAFWQPAHVFEMATIGGARAMGLEAELGSIAVGKKADLAVFDFRRVHLTPAIDALGNLVHCAQGRDVETVIVDGRVVVEGGRAVLVDQERVRREGEAAAARLWARARA
jgi:5-methylthioadenosine/S-adenosylhomocysteine deaminase